MPDAFYADWARVAREEGLHFSLLRAHLRTLGYDYGDMPAHDGLWEMAERTKEDLLARLALVPRTLEARGLDASPVVRRKLADAGDLAAAGIIDISCAMKSAMWRRESLVSPRMRNARADPLAAFRELAARYRAPKLRGPFNLPARRAAGFSDEELEALLSEAG